MYASNKLSPGPQTEAVRVGATARADDPTEEVIPAEENRMDGTVDVGVDASYARDEEDSNGRGRSHGTAEGTGLFQRVYLPPTNILQINIIIAPKRRIWQLQSH